MDGLRGLELAVIVLSLFAYSEEPGLAYWSPSCLAARSHGSLGLSVLTAFVLPTCSLPGFKVAAVWLVPEPV